MKTTIFLFFLLLLFVNITQAQVFAKGFVGDGSQLTNVKSLITYENQGLDIVLPGNESSVVVQTVTITAPGSGVVFVMANGYVDYDGPAEDCILACISTGTIVEVISRVVATDSNCPDPDQQGVWTTFRAYDIASAGTYTYNCVCRSFWSSPSKVVVHKPKMSAMYFPTGGAGTPPPPPPLKSTKIEKENDSGKKDY